MAIEPVSSDLSPPSGSIWPLAAHGVVEVWNPRTDTAATCQDIEGQPPWYRLEDNTESWQFSVLVLAPLLTVAIFVFALGARVANRRSRSPVWAKAGERAFQATGAAGLASALLFVVLWASSSAGPTPGG